MESELLIGSWNWEDTDYIEYMVVNDQATEEELSRALHTVVSRMPQRPNDGYFLKLLLSYGALITPAIIKTVHIQRDPNLYQEFANHGWDINSLSYGKTALRVATPKETTVKWLLERGADPNKTGGEQFGYTLEKTCNFPGSAHIIQTLIHCGAELTDHCIYNALMQRGKKGMEVTRLLLDYGGNPNAESVEWASPLHFAVTRKSEDRVKMLLQAGANRDIEDRQGRTPAELALSRNKKRLYSLLVE
ncbi:Ankyrin-1 [Dactylella cylindrospora]|nr:Ankyrin-1 [Dactylella cylindrospora]